MIAAVEKPKAQAKPRRASATAPATAGAENLSAGKKSARQAGLRYVTLAALDEGVRRVRSGKSFRYVQANGRPVRDEATLKRIRGLVLPPAWTDVRICPHADGHLQATGVDARGRRQYRYHNHWRAARDCQKYDSMALFAEYLPRIRRRVRADMATPGLPYDKVVATVARLLERTLIRVGNEEYSRANGSYGLTTMRNRHAKVERSEVTFTFVGKSGVKHNISVQDSRAAKVVKACRELPGRDLFGFVDEHGEVHDVTSADVNAYLRRMTGRRFSAKDFRTWAASVLALDEVYQLPAPTSPSDAKRQVAKAVANVAEMMGNTRAVCRKSYIHPAVLEAYCAGALPPAPRRSKAAHGETIQLSAMEKKLLELLKESSARCQARWKAE